MQHKAKSIRPFIGCRDFEVSRQFYRDLGFEESIVSHNMSLFKTDGFGFYLQNAYVKDWIDNTMVFWEVDDVERHWKELKSLDLPARYENVRITPIRSEHWGKEYFVHDPSGILWHFGEFICGTFDRRDLCDHNHGFVSEMLKQAVAGISTCSTAKAPTVDRTTSGRWYLAF